MALLLITLLPTNCSLSKSQEPTKLCTRPSPGSYGGGGWVTSFPRSWPSCSGLKMTFQQISVSKLWNLWMDLILQTLWFSYRSGEGAFFLDYPVDPQCSHIHPYKREAGEVLRDTLRRRRWCDDEGWDWSDVASSHGTLAVSRAWTRQRTDSPQSLWRKGGPVNILFLSTKSGDPSFWSSGLQNCGRIPVVFVVKFVIIFYVRKLIFPPPSQRGWLNQTVSQGIPFDFQALPCLRGAGGTCRPLDPLSPGRHFLFLPFLSLPVSQTPSSPFSLPLCDNSEESPCYGLNCVPLLNS